MSSPQRRILNPQLSKGSEWHRWDPHIHTPGTLFADEFGGDWSAYFTAIENAVPAVSALGITDYCVVASYKEFRRRQKEDGRAADVAFVFPNVEFRLSVETEKRRGINLHLIFSPEDPNHENEIERILSEFHFEYQGRKYRCAPDGLRQLGAAVDPRQTDPRGALTKGAEQFKLEIAQLREALRDKWMKENCLIAVCANTADGTSGLQQDNAFKALREELEALAHIIFSPRESDRCFWLGEKDGFPSEEIEKRYGSLKPCLHGSDAHRLDRVLRPDDDRFCWIRAEPSFAGLKQTLFEPATRIWVGRQPPPGPTPSETIDRIAVANATWLKTADIPLNDGLVTIIGPKGSGKTALADIVGCSADAEIAGPSSFLLKAKQVLGNASAHLVWADGSKSNDVQLADVGGPTEDEPNIKYLSQHFVEQLCSSENLEDELVKEIESVVFLSIPSEERLGATSFGDLRKRRLDHIARLRGQHLSNIHRFSNDIAEEDDKIAKIPESQRALDLQKKAIGTQGKELKNLLPKGKKEETKLLSVLQEAIEERSKALQASKLKREQLKALAEEFSHFQATVLQEYGALRDRYRDCGLTADEWATFEPAFSPAYKQALAAATQRIDEEVRRLEVPPERKEEDRSSWPLKELRATSEELSKQIGVEQQRARQFKALSKKLTDAKTQCTQLETFIKGLEEAKKRRTEAINARRDAYASVFETYRQEEDVLNQLYAPLQTRLESETGEENQLEFYVRRRVDVGSWVAKGEDLLDTRTSGPFQGRGTLLKEVEALLLPPWRTGGAQDIATAMDDFIEKHGSGLVSQRRREVSFQELGTWLFSTGHISLEYGIKFEGVELSRLSPGTRGIVLLMLYLAIDEWDTRPLVIDQPEENLDPHSVFDKLVPYFRTAKQRRQVILVTHNPNLVVNADADQVIVASAERESATRLPLISYRSGGLENRQTRDDVCRILEGGARAFRERERRYELPRDKRTTPE